MKKIEIQRYTENSRDYAVLLEKRRVLDEYFIKFDKVLGDLSYPLEMQYRRKGGSDRRWLIKLFENKGVIVVASIDDKPIGYAYAKKSLYEKTFILTEIYVDESYRKKGVSEQLLTNLEEYLKEVENIRYLVLSVHTQNTPALRLYTRSKFKPFTQVMYKQL